MNLLPYYNCCVGWPHHVDTLNEIIDKSIEVSRQALMGHVVRQDFLDLERGLGYCPGFLMARDWHVTYHRARIRGRWVYYVQHSGIENVFCDWDLFGPGSQPGDPCKAPWK
jgi:hypothetical protein